VKQKLFFFLAGSLVINVTQKGQLAVLESSQRSDERWCLLDFAHHGRIICRNQSSPRLEGECIYACRTIKSAKHS
jgi:hypothetical protein